MIEKPPYGSPCNGCGLCCEAALCPLAQHLFGREHGPCPAIEKQPDGRKACGLVLHPLNYEKRRTLTLGGERMGKSAAHLIGSGYGCDGIGYGEVPDPVARAKVLSNANFDSRESRRARKDWGI